MRAAASAATARWRTVVSAAVSSLTLGVAGCASHGFIRPEGPSRTIADASALWQQASAPCQSLTTYQTQLQLSGRVSDQPMGSLTVGVVATRAGEIGLEARASGSSAFVLGGRADRATLWLASSRRVVVDRADAIVDALVGLPWDPERLMAVLSGCVTFAGRATDAREYDGGITALRFSGGDDVYVETIAGRSSVRAAVVDGVVIDYRRAESGWPQQIALRSEPGRSPSVSLSMRIDVAVPDPAANPDQFAVAIPPGASPMSIDELRASGPRGR
ncbi:MAG TPA: hypothetical protein VHB78_10550 [Vicinamibacterales bacterium]|nr:hypothetical protein [Vicinamibacterales bacterium]